jgi:pimeloyl-ACP methyl ester carboxylesterase
LEDALNVMRERGMQRKIKIILSILIIIPLAVLAGFLIWAYTPLGPMSEALLALQSNGNANVSTNNWIVFQPSNMSTSTGFILYPGARIDPRSYAPAARTLAEEGFLVVIVPMPFNLAVFGVDLANGVIQAYPNIQAWAIGGHSLGGAMVASFAHKYPGAVKGIVLWASYPASTDNLSAQAIQAVSIYGTRDGLTSLMDINASRALLPASTSYVEIFGGNHAQFGWYGPQPGDNEAMISREVQQAQVINATLALLNSIS